MCFHELQVCQCFRTFHRQFCAAVIQNDGFRQLILFCQSIYKTFHQNFPKHIVACAHGFCCQGNHRSCASAIGHTNHRSRIWLCLTACFHSDGHHIAVPALFFADCFHFFLFCHFAEILHRNGVVYQHFHSAFCHTFQYFFCFNNRQRTSFSTCVYSFHLCFLL